MVIIPLLTWLTGECKPGAIAGPGGRDTMCGTGGGPPLVELEKLEPDAWSIVSPLFDFPQVLRSRSSKMRKSICSALVGYAMVLKNEMVLVKSALRRRSSTQCWSVGSRNTAESVSKLPHWLQTIRLECIVSRIKKQKGEWKSLTREMSRIRW